MDSSSGGSYGVPQKRLHGHGHFVSDVVLSSDGHFALSGSGTKLFDCGICQLVTPPGDLKATPRMS